MTPTRKKRKSSKARVETYYDHTRRPMNSLLFVLPLLGAFHLGAAAFGTALLAPRDMGSVLRYLGAGAWSALPALAVCIVLGLQQWFHRDRFEFQPKVLAGMVVESLILMVPLIAISHFTGWLLTPLAASEPAGAGRTIGWDALAALGSGIYEEFIFRLVLIALVLLAMVDLLGLGKRLGATVAVLLSALLFSAYHFDLTQLDWATFRWDRFVFFFLAGAYLGGIYVFRGFGVAAGTHICWNLYVLVWRHL